MTNKNIFKKLIVEIAEKELANHGYTIDLHGAYTAITHYEEQVDTLSTRIDHLYKVRQKLHEVINAIKNVVNTDITINIEDFDEEVKAIEKKINSITSQINTLWEEKTEADGLLRKANYLADYLEKVKYGEGA